jgi:outer membrane protein OmpA-like peptidoglycan-associated protein
MKSIRSILCLSCLTLLGGCSQNAYTLKGENSKLVGKTAELETRNRELETRANALDTDNRELSTQVAQTRQQGRIIEDQLAAVKEQLSTTTQQLAQVRSEPRSPTTTQAPSLPLTPERSSSILSAAHQRSAPIMAASSPTITPNNSLLRPLPAGSLPGIEVRQDGDVIRIELPSNKLFGLGSTTLEASGRQLVEQVAIEIGRNYPQQLIGIEGHTDPSLGAQAHQLSVDRALAVQNQLATLGQISPNQTSIAGHGGNHPVVSNATPAGRERNNRVELVIYPERR